MAIGPRAIRIYISTYLPTGAADMAKSATGWLRLVGSLKLQVSFAKEPYKRDDILQKRRMIIRSLLIVATPYTIAMSAMYKDMFLCIYMHTNHMYCAH